MPIHLGFIDSVGNPRLRIRVRGTNPHHFSDEEALVDTGFTGFMMLPVARALPLGLVLLATGDYTIADGSTINSFVASGTVTVGPPAGVDPSFLEEETVKGPAFLAAIWQSSEWDSFEARTSFS